MEEGVILELATKAILVVLQVSAPMLLLALIVGFAISIFQATTQIQEQTLTFVPKIFAVLGAILVFGSWMISVIKDFTLALFLNINNYIK